MFDDFHLSPKFEVLHFGKLNMFCHVLSPLLVLFKRGSNLLVSHSAFVFVCSWFERFGLIICIVGHVRIRTSDF